MPLWSCAARIKASDPREGDAPGTVVADLKRGFSHDVRTPPIQDGGTGDR